MMFMCSLVYAAGFIFLKELFAKESYPFPVYEVKTCPTNQSEYKERNAQFKCPNDTNGSPSYICIPNEEKSKLLEFCYPHTVGLFEKGNCLVLTLSGYLDHEKCYIFKSGCPEKPYLGNEFYKYPKCQEILQDLRCYKADLNCTSNPGDMGITLSTKEANNDAERYILMAAVIVGALILHIVLLLTIIIVFKKCRRHRSYSLPLIESENIQPTNVSDNRKDLKLDALTIHNGYKLSKLRNTEQVCRLNGSTYKVSLHFENPHETSFAEETKYMNYFVLLQKDRSLSRTFTSPRMFLKEQLKIDCISLPEDVDNFKHMCERNESLHCANDKVDFKFPLDEFETLCAFLQDRPCHGGIFNAIEVYFKNASKNAVAKFFRSSGYSPKLDEQCILLPQIMNELFIKKLDVSIIEHDTLEDVSIHPKVSEIVRVPKVVLQWEKNSRERFLQEFMEGFIDVHRARGMIVGCSSAGKTTLLRRLKGENIQDVTPTIGVDIHNEIFRVNTERKTIEVIQGPSDDEEKVLSITDFAGQCAYYACHQVYLSPRAFYIVVIDMTKKLELKVGREECEQNGTIFSDWTYKGYFEFWLRSLRVYCGDGTPVIIVATHRDKATGRVSQTQLFNSLLDSLPAKLDLKRYINYKRCFSIGLQIKDDLEVLKSCIFDLITRLPNWGERIPGNWRTFEYSVLQRGDKIMQKSELQSQQIIASHVLDNMLRFYHETGRILHFNEGKLADIIILDVQWFVDAFKSIISDENHVKQEALYTDEWQDFNRTGELNDKYLERIWQGNASYIQNKDKLLDYMERLGLIAKGVSVHYVPSMNKKDFDEQERLTLKNCSSKSSILMFRFNFLPYFIFCRLVVACMCAKGSWKTLLDEQNERKALYKNTAMFTFEEKIVVLSVTDESILAQVFIRDLPEISKNATHLVLHSLVDMLKKITRTFHIDLTYEIGFGCQREIIGEFDTKKMGFVPESDLKMKSVIDCPCHQRSGYHKVNSRDLLEPWNLKPASFKNRNSQLGLSRLFSGRKKQKTDQSAPSCSADFGIFKKTN